MLTYLPKHVVLVENISADLEPLSFCLYLLIIMSLKPK